jgi:predicted nucleic acid-binding Zn ribbon protein
MVGVLLIAVAIYVFIVSQGQARRSSGGFTGPDMMATQREEAAALAAARADPTFNAAAFANRVRMAFMKIQSAWSNQDLRDVRAFISDGVHERFSLQIDEQRSFGYRDFMSQITISGARLVEFAEGPVFDIVTLRIDASAVDYRASLKDGHYISGSRAAEPFAEYWSWMRRHGASRDPSKPGLIEGHCPNCGAAVEMNQAANCKYCGALLRSGEFDWVLAEITQASEWQANRWRSVNEMNLTLPGDPGFNWLDLEDRASVMYWRKTMADRIGKVDPLRKIASDPFCVAYRQHLQPEADGTRFYMTDCAVGSVRLLGVVPGKPVDSAVVMITWEGQRMMTGPRGTALAADHRMQVRVLYILQRNSGVQSDPGKSVSSAHCPRCGAPLMSDLSSACASCGAVMNDMSLSWVLVEMTSDQSPSGQQWHARLVQPWAKERYNT